MISFHLLAVPAEAITQYLASHSEYYAYDEDTDTSIYPDELFDIEQLCDSSTDHTSFEHHAELDAKILTKMGFGDLFEDGILDEDDEVYRLFQTQEVERFLKAFQVISSTEAFDEVFDKAIEGYSTDEKYKEWMKDLVNERLIPFFQRTVRDNEGFLAYWG